MTRTQRTGSLNRMRLIVFVLSAVIAATGCATNSGDAESEPELAEGTSSMSTTVPSSSTAPTTTQPAPTTSLPALDGVPYVGPGPREGDQVSVIGVAFDDVLMVRSGPGVDHTVVATLDPQASSIPVTGRAQLLSSSIWYEIDVDGATGWVNSSYIALLGATDDVTSGVVAAHGSIPTSDTMLGLGAIVAEGFAGNDSGTRVTVTTAPSVDDVGEVTYDITGIEDDSIIGYRLHVFGQRIDESGPFSLHSVERTMLCFRGVTDDGTCI